jgi:hypothetical protein
MSSMETTVREAKKPVDKKPALESQVLTAQALKEIEARIQKKLERLQKRIVPETVTIRLDDPNGAKNLLALQDYGKRFGTAFAEQATKVTEALKEVAQIGLDQPHQAIAFKRKREQALALVDTLSFSERKLEAAVSQGTDTKLPNSMREAMSNASDIFNSIKSDIEEVRRLIKTARRIIPTATAEHNSTSPSGTEPKVEVKTGSVASMPRLGKDLTIDPRKLVAMGHAMVEGIISDADLKESYRQVMSDFVTSYVRNFSNIRKEIYQSRIDGSEMNDLQKERLRFLAEVLGTETKVSDLYKLSSSRREQLDESFLSVMDSSPFQKALNEMKSEFAAALTKELDKKPGTEDTDTTYVAFKREKFETTEGFKRYEQAEKKQDEITRLSKEKQVL